MSEASTPAFVFISYSRADGEFVTHLETDLQAQGITTWIDREGLQPGTPDWEEALRTAIRAAQALLLIASPNARSSRYVKDELRIAEMYQHPAYPIWIAGTQWMEAVPLGWGGTQYIDAREPRYQAALRETVTVLSRLLSQPPPTPSQAREVDFEPRNPYKGLRAFTGADAPDFFGRETLIHELAQALQASLSAEKKSNQSARLLTVIGPSGSGKSSVVMAGLLPCLQAGELSELPGSKQWVYLDPMVPGVHPIESLTVALSQKLGERPLKAIREDLEDESARGLHLLATALAKGQETKVVLLIDQFEELFTQTTSEQERRRFIDLLVTAITEPRGPVMVILTLRADFSDRPMHYPELGQLIEAHRTPVLPMDLQDLRAVIEKPAEQADVRLTFEGNLVGDLLFEVQGRAGALPLLQFTLDQLFQRRNAHQLTLEAYREIGGVRGALAKHAESTYAALPTEAHRELARVLFLRLIDPGQTEQDTTRRRAALTELSLPDPTQTVMLRETSDAFIAARLLTTNEVAGITTIEVSHEALIREWTRLADWLRTSRNDILLQEEVSEDAAEWRRRGKPADRLYRGTELVEAQGWAERNMPSIDEVAFLEASTAEQERQAVAERAQQARELGLQRRAVRRQRYVIGLMGLTAIVLVAGLVVALLLQAQLLASLPVSVTNLNDHGPGSLREAIATASDGSAITFSQNLTGTITLTSGELKITKNLVITGPGASVLAISGGNASRVFDVIGDVVVTISNVTIKNGHTAGSGGGIVDNNIASTLVLINSTISGNRASGDGGGIYSEGTLSVTNSAISDNTSSGFGGGIYSYLLNPLTVGTSTVSSNKSNKDGGGIYNEGGNLTLTGSIVSDNRAIGNGGGMVAGTNCACNATVNNKTIVLSSIISDNRADSAGGGIENNTVLDVEFSTISGNQARDGGGIANSFDSIDLYNSTISGNTAVSNGGGIANTGGIQIRMSFCTIYANKATRGGGIANDTGGDMLTITASIVAGDLAGNGPDIVGAVDLVDAPSLIQNASGSDMFFPSSQLFVKQHTIIGQSPHVGPLRDNGGSIQTHALLPGSPAIDQIPLDACHVAANPLDERGVKRPDGNEQFCDMGAYESTE